MKKIKYFRMFLYFLLGVSLIFYFKIYILEGNINVDVMDLPSEITDSIWYEYNSLDALKFSAGHFEYISDDDYLSSCNKYFYNEEEKVINFNCTEYSMKLISVSKYRLILTINGIDVESDTYTYYNSLELVNYLIANNMEEATEEEIEKIMIDNDFIISKNDYDEEYKSIQLNKLSAISELSIDEYISLKNSNSKAIVFLINPSMSVESYDLIPVFISWKEKYTNYDFYYVNGSNLTINDYELLDRDKVLKDYLVGLYENNILIFNNNSCRKINVFVIRKGNDNTIFNCTNEECNEVELSIYDNETVYERLDDVFI